MGSSPITTSDLAAAIQELKDWILMVLPAKIEEKLADIQGHITAVESKLEESNKDLKERLDKMESKVREHDDRGRRNNLLFQGIEDKATESWDESEKTVMDFDTYFDLFNSKNPPRFDRVHRLGAFRKGYARPIIARFTFYKEKALVLSKARNLKGSSYFMSEDFSIETREIRKELYPLMLKARSQGKRANLVVDKLKIEGRVYDANYLKNHDPEQNPDMALSRTTTSTLP